MLSKYKIDSFKNQIAALPDTPQLSAQELKRYFDASPEELKNALNGVIVTLTGAEGAENVGFRKSDKVHAGTVQEAIENVQGQIKNVVLGQIPEGSVGFDLLAAEVTDRLDAFDAADTTEREERLAQASAEAEARQTEDKRLDSRITSVQTNLQANINNNFTNLNNAKCSITVGGYSGNGSSTRLLTTGFQPKFVICGMQDGGQLYMSYSNNYRISLRSNGFQVDTTLNASGSNYDYIAFR